ncbi:glycosyltransferase family 4 protein [Demetria terragena]|uniref:glycosyltransferase family 4 protein n=1 Tax=Demetria terragena TaxID=63959 RepID=UPI0003722482|nr:glycosyltransferase family 4 protein [Demetria terragena]
MSSLTEPADSQPESLTVWLVNQYAIRPGDAGIARHNMLAERLAQGGIAVSILAGGRHYARQTSNMLGRAGSEILEGVEYRWLPVRNYQGNGFERVLSMLAFGATVARVSVQGPKPDVIIGSSPHLFGAFGAWLLARRVGSAFVLEVRDMWPGSLIHMTGMSPNHPVALGLGVIEKVLYRNADQIVGVLPGVGDRVEEVVPGGRDKVTWIPNGVELAEPSTSSQRTRGDRPFVFAYTGTHGVPNSLDTLIDAAEILRDRGRHDLEFHLYGDGVSKADLVERAQSKNLKNVIFHEFVAKSEVAGILEAADGLTLCWRDTALYEHGVSPNKIFDYFAAQRPVVQGLSLRPELDPVASARAGVTVPAEDPVALADAYELVADLSPEQRDAMGARGRAYAEAEHDMNKLGRRLAGVLRSAVERRRLSAGRGRRLR